MLPQLSPVYKIKSRGLVSSSFAILSPLEDSG